MKFHTQKKLFFCVCRPLTQKKKLKYVHSHIYIYI